MTARFASFGLVLVLAPQLAASDPQFLPQTGHWYDFVSSTVCWDVARDAAAATTFQGQPGYLATITTQAENDFIVAQFGLGFAGSAWIGASDAGVEEDWRWVTGPETGLQFWQGDQTGATTPPFSYANWGSSEPNDFLNEDYGVIALGTLGATILQSEWGDANLCGQNAFLAGYIVEFPEDAVEIPVLAPWGLALLGTALAGMIFFVGRAASTRSRRVA